MTTHLTSEQLAQVETALVQRQRELERQISQHLEGDSRPEHARNVLLQDGDDAPARDADREVDLARSDHDINELGSVNAALKRLPTPQYGLCSNCGSDIPVDRLLSNPQALRCVTCQSAHEAKRGPAHHPTL
ncbi:MAG: TraR/DksA C4-type zinc finger protein [Burkholderiaceae bacterium]|nr:TraR/DksA C4-type zinc finger protein [Burkholderiaceae bacterium]MDH3459995.1 TraR/DksA C4-type zinc finger protein [Burkholderiaceae bacterium]